VGVEGRVDAVRDDRALEVDECIVGNVVIGEAHRDRVACAERRSRQRGVVSQQAGRARQYVGAADVGDQTDAHLRHGHLRGVGDDAVAAVCADADAAAHHDAVHQRDVRLRIARDAAVHHVLVPPEPPVEALVATGAVVNRDDVAAGAQAAFALAGQHDGAYVVVIPPFGQCLRDR
jgi:hypothetical protein